MEGRQHAVVVAAILLGSFGLGSTVYGQVYVTPGPAVVVRPGFDPYQDAVGRLRSKHDKSRRDGAITLGKLRDARAVPDLVWVLQNDHDEDVRTAAAFALGAIGDGRAANSLRVAAMKDKSQKVRQAATHAHGILTFATAPPPVPVPVR